MFAVMRRAVLLLAALPLLTCGRPAGPADAYRAFAAAVRAGDEEAIWAMLSSASRAALEARAKAAAKAGGAMPGSARQLLVGDAVSSMPRVKSVTVRRESGDEALLAVTTEDAGEGQVRLVREEGGWRVVLPVFDSDRAR